MTMPRKHYFGLPNGMEDCGTDVRNIEEISRTGFGMRYRAANCSGCNRVIVHRGWRKLKPMHGTCPYCEAAVYFVIIHWPGYINRMEDGAKVFDIII